MAKVLVSLFGSSTPTVSLREVWALRLASGLVVLLGSILFFLGTSWDIQWHSLIGRDRTLIPPHDVMLTGVALSGIAALAAVCIESLWARRNPAIAQNGTNFADAFHGSLGAYMAGFAALDVAIAFPLDAYWHSLYGIDVSIWAPFHIMIIAGMAIVALGAAYMLVSATRLAEYTGAGLIRVGYAGVIVAFASMLSIFTFLVINALDDFHLIHLGSITISVFPVLAVLLSTWTFVSVVHAVPGRWAATSTAVVSLILVAIVALYVPPATDFLVKQEHLSYRENIRFALVAFEWPLAPTVAAVAIDIVTGLARRKGWSRTMLMVSVAIISLIACLPVMPIFPLLTLDIVRQTGAIGFIASLFLGLLSAFAGTWFGQRMGVSLQNVERNA